MPLHQHEEQETDHAHSLQPGIGLIIVARRSTVNPHGVQSGNPAKHTTLGGGFTSGSASAGHPPRCLDHHLEFEDHRRGALV
jgi:hypothetical protein